MNGIATASKFDSQGPGKARSFPSQAQAAGLTVEYSGAFNLPVTQRLREVANGTRVYATGHVTNIQLHGPANARRAVVVLTSATGDNAVVHFAAGAYRQYAPLLVRGNRVRIAGDVRRYFDPAFLHGVDVRAVA